MSDASMSQRPPSLELRGITRTFHPAGEALTVLDGVDMSLRASEVTALVGPSGAGKSTLLHIAGLLEPPTSGEILIDGVACGALSDRTHRTPPRRDRGVSVPPPAARVLCA